MRRGLEPQEPEPAQGEQSPAVPQAGGFGRPEVEVLQEGGDIELGIYPARHVLGDVGQLPGPVTAAGVLEIDDPDRIPSDGHISGIVADDELARARVVEREQRISR